MPSGLDQRDTQLKHVETRKISQRESQGSGILKQVLAVAVERLREGRILQAEESPGLDVSGAHHKKQARHAQSRRALQTLARFGLYPNGSGGFKQISNMIRSGDGTLTTGPVALLTYVITPQAHMGFYPCQTTDVLLQPVLPALVHHYQCMPFFEKSPII